MNDQFKDIEPMVYKSKISVPYSWWAGDTASAFLTSLRDNKQIKGLKCGKCEKVYIPPRKTCPTCFVENKEWVLLSGEGTLQTFTILRKQLASAAKKVPVIYGLIKLDGADTAILHFLEKINPDDIKIGARFKAVFSEKRNGNIKDIAYFEPIK